MLARTEYSPSTTAWGLGTGSRGEAQVESRGKTPGSAKELDISNAYICGAIIVNIASLIVPKICLTAVQYSKT